MNKKNFGFGNEVRNSFIFMFLIYLSFIREVVNFSLFRH